MKIVWTIKAQNRLQQISNYIRLEFGETAAASFKIKAKDFTRLLSQFPEIGILEDKGKNLRAFQLAKQTRVFYRLKGDRIIILTLFDSRQHPEKKPH